MHAAKRNWNTVQQSGNAKQELQRDRANHSAA
jgi:hypothetical protein